MKLVRITHVFTEDPLHDDDDGDHRVDQLAHDFEQDLDSFILWAIQVFVNAHFGRMVVIPENLPITSADLNRWLEGLHRDAGEEGRFQIRADLDFPWVRGNEFLALRLFEMDDLDGEMQMILSYLYSDADGSNGHDVRVRATQ